MEMHNTPQLRFPEFSGAWEDVLFKDILKINQGLQIAITERLTEEEPNTEFYITNEFLKTSSNKKYYIKNPPKSVICDEDDILMTRTGNTGMVVTGVKGAFHNNFFKIAYPKTVDKNFLVNYLNLPSIQNQILKLAGTSTIPDLNHSDFYRISFIAPELKEQQKIASFLSATDKKLEQLQQKKTLLEQYKKGMMQKLFSQQIRFKDDEGKEFPEWRNGYIKNFGFFYYGKSAPKFSIFPDAPTPCIRYGELYSKYRGIIDKVKSYTNIDRKDLKFSKGGEVLIPRVGEKPEDFASCSYLPIPNIAIGEMISVYNTKENGLYITYYFNHSMKYEFAKVVEGGNVSNLYFKYLEDIKVQIPSLAEQTKIADFLTAIDAKIAVVSVQVDAAKAFKRGLLQQMFV